MSSIIDKIKFLFRDGFFHILTGNTLIKIISFISSIVIVRLVTKADYAYLAFADNLYSYVSLISGLGMSSAILIYCGREEKKDTDWSFFSFACTRGAIVQSLGTVVVLVYFLHSASAFENAKALVILLIPYPIMTYLIATITAYMRSHLNNQLFMKVSVWQVAVVFVFSVLLTICIGISGVVYARYVGIVVVILISLNYLKKTKNEKHNRKLYIFEKRQFVGTSISLMIANMTTQLMMSNEMLLVNLLIKDENITANYKVAVLIPSQLIFLTSSITIYFFPKVAKIKEKKEVWRYVKSVEKYTFIMVAAILVAAMIMTPVIVRVAYGEKYLDAVNLMNCFWIAYGISAAVRVIPFNVLPAIGYGRQNAIISIITCVMHFAIDYYCISNYGAYGVAYASIIVYLLSGIYIWMFLRKKCRNEV